MVCAHCPCAAAVIIMSLHAALYYDYLRDIWVAHSRRRSQILRHGIL